MASIPRIALPQPNFMFGVLVIPTNRGRWVPDCFSPISRQLLSTDSLGNMTLTLTNVVIGSRIRIEEQASGALIEDRAATGTTEVFTVPVYSGGNPSNDLRIKVRKGTSGPKYQPFETLAVAAIGTQSVYIAQVADAIA
jgi:hypothetical protein